LVTIITIFFPHQIKSHAIFTPTHAKLLVRKDCFFHFGLKQKRNFDAIFLLDAYAVDRQIKVNKLFLFLFIYYICALLKMIFVFFWIRYFSPEGWDVSLHVANNCTLRHTDFVKCLSQSAQNNTNAKEKKKKNKRKKKHNTQFKDSGKVSVR
jgi:hypothetical protein